MMLAKLDTYLERDQSILLLCTNINSNLLESEMWKVI